MYLKQDVHDVYASRVNFNQKNESHDIDLVCRHVGAYVHTQIYISLYMVRQMCMHDATFLAHMLGYCLSIF
jgi:hypothetical protein